MNTKKNTPIPISTTIAVTAMSNVIDNAAIAESIVPAEPNSKHLAYLQKQLFSDNFNSLLELIKPDIIT